MTITMVMLWFVILVNPDADDKNLHEIAEMFDISSLRVDQLHNHLAQLLSIGQLSEYEEIVTMITKIIIKKIMMTNLLGVSC